MSGKKPPKKQHYVRQSWREWSSICMNSLIVAHKQESEKKKHRNSMQQTRFNLVKPKLIDWIICSLSFRVLLSVHGPSKSYSFFTYYLCTVHNLHVAAYCICDNNVRMENKKKTLFSSLNWKQSKSLGDTLQYQTNSWHMCCVYRLILKKEKIVYKNAENASQNQQVFNHHIYNAS